jgi:hypothetical protein
MKDVFYAEWAKTPNDSFPVVFTCIDIEPAVLGNKSFADTLSAMALSAP